MLLRSLPLKFEALVQSLKINDAITIEEVYTHIKDYCEASSRTGLRERHRPEGSRHQDREEQAFAAREKRKSKKYKCYCCGSQKHMVRKCPKRVRNSDSESDSDGDTSTRPGSNSGHDKMRKRNKVITDRAKARQERNSKSESDSEHHSAWVLIIVTVMCSLGNVCVNNACVAIVVHVMWYVHSYVNLNFKTDWRCVYVLQPIPAVRVSRSEKYSHCICDVITRVNVSCVGHNCVVVAVLQVVGPLEGDVFASPISFY